MLAWPSHVRAGACMGILLCLAGSVHVRAGVVCTETSGDENTMVS